MRNSTTPAHAPPNLAQLQTALGAYILHGQESILPAIVEQGGLTAKDRLGIYHTAYRLRLLEVLQDHFAQTLAYMGDDFFESQALAYIQAHPPAHDNLRHYGAQWPQWLAQQHPQDTDMADLSRLEWALRHTFDAPDTPVLTWADVTALTPSQWDRLGFTLAPGAHVLRLEHAVISLWQSLANQDIPEPVQALCHDVLVWRQGWQPHFRSLDPEEARALRELLAGQSFNAACATALQSHTDTDAATLASQWLQRWMAEQLLAQVTV
jgi:hypothetical protein